jgi:lysophospholipase L1-like esterase
MSNVNARVILFAAVLLAVALAVAGAIEVGASSARSPGPQSTLVAFYGDSYTRGSTASSPAKRWTTIVCRDHGWREFNPSLNGLGFVHNRRVVGRGDVPDQIIRRHPDVVVVTLGLNDNFSYPVAASAVHRQIGADLRRLKSGLPRARIVVVEPFWYSDARPPSVGIIAGWVRRAAADIGADYIPGASHWIEHHPEWMAGDGLHPNDVGYAQIAARMNAELGKLGL